MVGSSGKNHIFEGRIKEFEQVLVDFILDSGKAKSADLKIQLILAYLAIHKELTQKQLKDLTNFSISTISKKLRNLTDLGIIEKRKIQYRNENLYFLKPEIYQRVADSSWDEFEKIAQFLNEKLDELKKFKNQRGYDLLSERIQELLKTFQLIEKIWDSLKELIVMPKKE